MPEINTKIKERSVYYMNRFQDSYSKEITTLVNAVIAAHLHGVSVGLRLAGEMVDAETHKTP